MDEERMTYADLKLPHQKKQDKRHPTNNKRRESPWKIIAIILGIICFFLLLAIAVFGYIYFQISSENKREALKDTPKHTVSTKAEDHANHLNLSVLSPHKDKDSNTCHEKWSCCGTNCYYFSKEEKTWDESKKSCEDLGSSLIKIDTKEEQIFIQSRVQYNYWVGLHRKGTTHPWMWLDNSEISPKLNFQQTTSGAKCGHLKSEYIVTAVCQKPFPFICKKKFPCLGN